MLTNNTVQFGVCLGFLTREGRRPRLRTSGSFSPFCTATHFYHEFRVRLDDFFDIRMLYVDEKINGQRLYHSNFHMSL